MDLNNFTEKSREALTEAQNIGTRLQHQTVDAEHLMLGLLEQESGLARSLFEKKDRQMTDLPLAALNWVAVEIVDTAAYLCALQLCH